MTQRKLIVIADDFSGAAEIAGIGQARGLATVVQVEPDFSVDAGLIAWDSNTRSLGVAAATEKLRAVARQLDKLDAGFHLFKKVDSAMRGHLAEEIKALVPDIRSKRVLLMPANPGKGRKIVNGCYAINGVPLHESVFKSDPFFPAHTCVLEEIINMPDCHRHSCKGDVLPDHGIVTVDLETQSDFSQRLRQASKSDLICGAAECFEAYLDWLGIKSGGTMLLNSGSRPFTLIINGSTVKHEEERALFKRLNLPVFALPGCWRSDRFAVTEQQLADWHNSVMESLSTCKTVAVAIEQSVKAGVGATDLFNSFFVALVKEAAARFGLEQLNIGLTGGATAAVVIRHLAIQQLRVVGQAIPGVVTLDSPNGARFTIKPGSYFWPAEFIKHEYH